MRLLYLAILSFCIFQLNAQNSFTLTIDHMVDGVEYYENTVGTNNLGNQIDFTRVQYYLSDISITHDGGQKTTFDELYVLVDAADYTSVDLGELNMDQIEYVTIHVGVAPEVNHLDPAQYDADHPLAPKNPSMHWGWAGGYRFIAIEGNSGSQMNQKVELHGLDTINYHAVHIVPEMVTNSNTTELHITANYEKIVEDIDVSGGLISHGPLSYAKQAMENFRDLVFSNSINSQNEIELVKSSLLIYPNPSNNGVFTISSKNGDYPSQIQVQDLQGRTIQTFSNLHSATSIQIEIPGTYFVKQMYDGQKIAVTKIVRL